ncbi:hypothetical protein GUITHDRAFT_160950 [Guillardia theta CCMP2712]|uniref:LysM domain-containing protein n=1 Tax=Guillardia theta (strain CCMP2712) TaxID=905079 RepID=L1JZS4_GUITC|nr:hypothetical protein GUITHDRAFT_160950 [Guillardia theta CCMP2712]EKX53852.1 hypothetical protein GUITHDRAFT_160950 [Guillardia theta CCMP2712]|mmetsp:Transcript_18267/g.60013  ORF Transcript_18267/g.60013 Transcript_18267/m.60013 type:complete len:261 (-) Transcript_18267:109-891(-)|eukprot:XP_005840832.1 hypothetical protein GUITHDRAFT_160950 [Guillardia theta CCMP2712]
MPSTALCGLKLILSPILLLLCVVVAQPAVASNVTCPQFEVASSQLYRTTSVGCTLTVDLNFHVKPGLSLDTNSVKLTHDVVMGVSLPSLQSTQFASSPPKTEAFTNMIYYVSRVVWTPELVHSAQTYLLNVFVPTCDTSSLLRVTVNKCKMCLSEDQTLESIAGLYNRHWSQIWSVNPFLLSPDKISAGQEINLGIIYSTTDGDTLMLLSVRFGISLDLLKQLNPEIPASAFPNLGSNTSICVIPETCPEFRARVPGITW